MLSLKKFNTMFYENKIWERILEPREKKNTNTLKNLNRGMLHI